MNYDAFRSVQISDDDALEGGGAEGRVRPFFKLLKKL